MKHLWPRPDFLATAPRTSRLAWLWLVTAAAVFAVTAQEVWALRQTTATLSHALARAESSLKKATTGVTTRPESVSPRGSLTLASTAAQRKAQALVRQLDQPWGQILSTLEMETPPGLQWLMFDRTADNAELRFEGLAPSGDVALELVTRLSARKGWTYVVMSRLQAPNVGSAASETSKPAPVPGAVPGPVPERVPEPSALSLWRFEIKARFDGKELAASSQRSQ
jgi:hypothetical protein